LELYICCEVTDIRRASANFGYGRPSHRILQTSDSGEEMEVVDGVGF
jgi:hypothetical protein